MARLRALGLARVALAPILFVAGVAYLVSAMVLSVAVISATPSVLCLAASVAVLGLGGLATRCVTRRQQAVNVLFGGTLASDRQHHL